MDNEDINNNKSDWLNKIKKDVVFKGDQEETILDEDENEIEVELKDKGEEKEKVIEVENKKKDLDEIEKPVIEQPSSAALSEHEKEPYNQIIEAKEEMMPDSEQAASNETASNVLIQLSKDLYAHFLLINIDSSMKEIRKLPRYIPINNARTLLGRYAKANIILDDPNSIEIKHAKLTFEDRSGKKKFYLYPINDAIVLINGESLTSTGNILKSGDLVKIGSACLIFFHYDLEGVK